MSDFRCFCGEEFESFEVFMTHATSCDALKEAQAKYEGVKS